MDFIWEQWPISWQVLLSHLDMSLGSLKYVMISWKCNTTVHTHLTEKCNVSVSQHLVHNVIVCVISYILLILYYIPQGLLLVLCIKKSHFLRQNWSLWFTKCPNKYVINIERRKINWYLFNVYCCVTFRQGSDYWKLATQDF